RSPLAGQNQLGIAIAIEIGENRAAHQSNPRQQARVFHIGNELATLIAVEPGRGRLRIASWNYAASHEQVQVPITVNVAQEDWASAPFGALSQLFDRAPHRIVSQNIPAGF